MHSLTLISEIDEASFELFEAAGFLDCETLAAAAATPVFHELMRANGILKIAEEVPRPEQIETWIRAARMAIGMANTSPTSRAVMPVNFEALAHVKVLLDEAPCAIPFPGRKLAESKIPVSQISPAILLNRCNGDLEIRIEDHSTCPISAFTRTTGNQYVKIAEKTTGRSHSIDLPRYKSSDELVELPRRRRHHSTTAALPVERGDESSLILAGTRRNDGKSGKPRRFIRGVYHIYPWSVRIGAISTLLLLAMIPVSIITAPLLVLSDLDPVEYHWVEPWWIIFPLMLPIIALLWWTTAFTCSCRICRIKLFVPKKHLKNAKAHRLPVLGYIIPLCFHLLIFQWFRCTHCGTPVRLV